MSRNAEIKRRISYGVANVEKKTCIMNYVLTNKGRIYLRKISICCKSFQRKKSVCHAG